MAEQSTVIRFRSLEKRQVAFLSSRREAIVRQRQRNTTKKKNNATEEDANP